MVPSKENAPQVADLRDVRRAIHAEFVRRQQGRIHPGWEENLVNSAIRYLTGKPERVISTILKNPKSYDWLDFKRIKTICELAPGLLVGHRVRQDRLRVLQDMVKNVTADRDRSKVAEASK